MLALWPSWHDEQLTMENVWPAVWAGVLGLITLGAGLWRQFYEPQDLTPHDTARVLVLTVGGLAGLVTALLGIAFGWVWWENLTSWLRPEKGTGIEHVVLTLGTFCGGLALMFLSLQLGRSRERSNATLRRLLYGYNAVLTGVLLLAILLVCNVMVATAAPKVVDFTSSGMYSLSSRAKNVLESLKQPTRIYVVLSRAGGVLPDVMTLLDNCRAVNDRIEVTVVSPDSAQAEDLARKYADLDVGRGDLVVVYGEGEHPEHALIHIDDLFTRGDFDATNPEAKRSIKFKGEDALITQLEFLEAGKNKPVIYFTQGAGEYDLNDRQPGRPDNGVGLFRDKLEKRNFNVKPLTFSPSNSKVPDDAALVVIARPQYPWPDYALKALDTYMKAPSDPKKPGGRLLILFDMNVSRSGKVQHTGLEDFVARFNVRVTDQRILSYSRDPLRVIALGNPEAARTNPLAAAFARDPFVLTDARLVEPGTSRQPGSSYDAQTAFAVVAFQVPIWAEGDLQTDISQLYQELRGNRQLQMQKFSKPILPVGVSVTETSGFNPHSFMRQQSEDSAPKPRLVVFGNSRLIANTAMSNEGGGQGDLFSVAASCIEWLRNRPQSIGIEPKSHGVFTLSPGTETLRMALLPGFLMLLGVVGVGAGVWLVRRR